MRSTPSGFSGHRITVLDRFTGHLNVRSGSGTLKFESRLRRINGHFSCALIRGGGSVVGLLHSPGTRQRRCLTLVGRFRSFESSVSRGHTAFGADVVSGLNNDTKRINEVAQSAVSSFDCVRRLVSCVGRSGCPTRTERITGRRLTSVLSGAYRRFGLTLHSIGSLPAARHGACSRTLGTALRAFARQCNGRLSRDRRGTVRDNLRSCRRRIDEAGAPDQKFDPWSGPRGGHC